MGHTGQVNTVKKYKKGNITAAFGSDLFTHGSTAIPNLLLKLYKQMGITDSEMMLITQLFRLRTEEKQYLPSILLLTEQLSGDEEQINAYLENLIHKEVIRVTEYFDPEKGIVIKGYDFEPLFEKLSEVWACAKVKENENIKKLMENEHRKAINLYSSFENEFGRPLSPMEIEQINLWSKKLNPVVVLEALRRAVLMGKHNFKYIDGILLEWEKNNISSPESIADYDQKFKKKQLDNKTKNITKRNTSNKEDKKSLIQSLYMS